MQSDQLCDQLFNSQDDFWQRDADFSSRVNDCSDACSYGPQVHNTPGQGRAKRQPPRSAALGYETIERRSPEGATLTCPIVVTSTPATQTTNKPTSWWRKLNAAGLCGGLMLVALLLAKGIQTEHTTTRPIEAIRPANKVIVDAPKEALATDIARLTDREVNWNASDGSMEVEGVADPLRTLADATPEEITRADYRLIKLRAYDVWADGTLDQINVETLQPWQWIQQHEAHVGAFAPLPLDAFEMGLPEGMTGTVDDILPCPEFEQGRGRIVLTTVNHLNRDVIELTLEDKLSQRETLRPTGTHKFYSVSSGQWLSASDLQPGETPDGLNGKVTVVATRKLPGTRRVYNFTVQGEHLYRVANCGVLVHNNGCSRPATDAYRAGWDRIFASKGLATGADEAMFWSGVGRGGDRVAANVATQQGRATLETTLSVRRIKLPKWDASNPASVAAWRQASHDFAAGASGHVRVLQGDAIRIKSVWAEVEFPALKANPNVKSITAVDAKTGAEVLLWSR